MINMISLVNSFVSSTVYNESLASLITQKIKESKKKPFTGDYYNLTDLCNPAKAYYDRINPPVEKSAELQKILEWGNNLHLLTQKWLETFQDIVTVEGTLDGAWVEVPRVKGRIDCRIGESIFEIKTKPIIPLDVKEILEKYPHDLEQVCFYSVIHPCHDKTNYLLFIKDSFPNELRVFRVEIKDINRIKEVLKKRIELLDEAIKTKNPLLVGRCRYFNSKCEFETAKSCHCEKMPPLSTEQIEKSIEIVFDEEMTLKLEELRKKFHDSKTFFTTKDIISPRKYNLKSEYIPEQGKSESQNYLHTLVKKLQLYPSFDERKRIIDSIQEPKLRIANRWINIKGSAKEESLPYIVKSTMSANISPYPNASYKAELGIIVSNHKKSKGIIFVIYPKINDFVQAFEVTYKNTGDILTKTKEIIAELEKKEIDLFSLPPCPSYMNDKGTCPRMKECNFIAGKGCVQQS